MSSVDILKDTFADIADAIREKEDSTGSIPVDDMASRIAAIETYVEPTITVNDVGLVTATTGDKSVTYQISSADDADFVAGNIAEGTNVFGVTGTAELAGSLAEEMAAQDELIEQLYAALEGKMVPESGSVETATVTLVSSVLPSNEVYYTDANGVQTSTHGSSPFTCAVPSIFVLNATFNTIISVSGNIDFLRRHYQYGIFAITGDGTITLTANSGGSDA